MTYQIKKVFEKVDFNSRRPTKVYIIEGEFVKFIVESRRRDGARQKARKLAGKMSKDNLVQVSQYGSTKIGRLDIVRSSKAKPLRPQWHKRSKTT